MKYTFLILLSLTIISCKTEQQKNDEVSQKIIAANWPPKPDDDTHYKVDTLNIERIERISPRETIKALIARESETVDWFNRQLKEAQANYESTIKYRPELAKYLDKPTPDKLSFYSLFVRSTKKIDSLNSLKIDTTSKSHYLILATLSTSSTKWKDHFTEWLYVDSDYKIWYGKEVK